MSIQNFVHNCGKERRVSLKHLSQVNDLFTHAARPSDEPVPTGASAVQPRGAAPNSVFETREVSYADATAMIESFHYSHDLPNVVRQNFGAYVGAELVAVACYGPIVSRKAPKEWLELRRLVKRPGSTIILSQFLAETIRILKARKVEAILSWADPEQDHHGGIYQATNWVYTEQKKGGNHTFVTETGKHIHPRTVYAMFGTQSVPVVLAKNPGWTSFLPKTKHRYLMPLCTRKNKALALLRTKEMPYPKPTKSTEPEPWE